MFADLDETLRQLLIQRGNLDSGEVDIAFDMPTREWGSGLSKPTVNLYLFDIRENTDLKNPSAWVTRRGPGNTAIKSLPDSRVDLTYNITAFANAVEDEHRLLSRVLLTLLQYPLLPSELLEGEVAGQEIAITVAHPSGLIQSPADYWGALDNDIRPAIELKATLRLDLSQEISVGLALTSRFRLGHRESDGAATEVKESSFRIGGRVSRSTEPESGLPGVAVTLLEKGLDTVTDDAGKYRFSGVEPGDYTLILSGPDLEEQRHQIQVPGASYDLSI